MLMHGPRTRVDQVKAIQGLLRDLKFLRDTPDGLHGPATREAIRDYERTMSLAQTGEPSKALFELLKEMRNLTASSRTYDLRRTSRHGATRRAARRPPRARAASSES